MLATIFDETIRPNRSLSRRGLCWAIVALTLPALLIGVIIALVGGWLVLPFAGLEAVAVCTGFRLARRRLSVSEQVRVSEQYVTVTRVEAGRRQCCRYLRYWTQVRLSPGGCAWYPTRLTIGSHGKFIEIGTFLTDAARARFARRLRRAIGGLFSG